MHTDWMRTKVGETTDRGNNLMVAQFVFFFSHAEFFKKVQWKWMSKTVNVIVKNKLRAFSHLEFLMSLHGQAMYIFWNQTFVFLFSQEKIAFVHDYIRQANFATNLA